MKYWRKPFGVRMWASYMPNRVRTEVVRKGILVGQTDDVENLVNL